MWAVRGGAGKHALVGGYAASFRRHGTDFDIGIEGLCEIALDSWLAPFLAWCGVSLDLEAREEFLSIDTGRGVLHGKGSRLHEDPASAFPGESRRVRRFVDLNADIVREMFSGPAPKPPSEMGAGEKILFGMRPALRSPHLLANGLRNSFAVLPAFFGEGDLLSIAAIPRGMAAAIERRGGLVLTSKEVAGLVSDGWGDRVSCADGLEVRARKAVVAAPLPWAVFSLFAGDPRFEALRWQIRHRRTCPVPTMGFLAVALGFALEEANYVVDWPRGYGPRRLWAARQAGKELDPMEAPLACIVNGAGHGGGPGRGETQAKALIVMATLGWDHAARWGRGLGGGKGGSGIINRPEEEESFWAG